MTALAVPEREEPPYNTVHNLKPQTAPAKLDSRRMEPLTRMQAGILVGLVSEAAQLVKNLKVLEFTERCEQEIRGGTSSSQLGGRVSGTKEPATPELDNNDIDYLARRDEAAGELKRAVRALLAYKRIEDKVLIPVEVASPFMAKQASMVPSCKTCGKTKEQYLKRFPRGLWRLRGGDCYACYRQKWDERQRQLDATEGTP